MGLWRFFGSLITTGAVLVLMRWLFHAGRPRDDLRSLERVIEGAEHRLMDSWEAIKRYYGPVTDEMRQAWADLHFRFVKGEYGEEGT